MTDKEAYAINTLPEMVGALKKLADAGVKTHLTVIREPRGVKQKQSFYWAEVWGKKKKKTSSDLIERLNRAVAEVRAESVPTRTMLSDPPLEMPFLPMLTPQQRVRAADGEVFRIRTAGRTFQWSVLANAWWQQEEAPSVSNP